MAGCVRSCKHDLPDDSDTERGPAAREGEQSRVLLGTILIIDTEGLQFIWARNSNLTQIDQGWAAYLDLDLDNPCGRIEEAGIGRTEASAGCLQRLLLSRQKRYRQRTSLSPPTKSHYFLVPCHSIALATIDRSIYDQLFVARCSLVAYTQTHIHGTRKGAEGCRHAHQPVVTNQPYNHSMNISNCWLKFISGCS